MECFTRGEGRMRQGPDGEWLPRDLPQRRTLTTEICAALVFKLIALLVLYVAFFGPFHRVPMTDDLVVKAILAATLSRASR